jgi:hypothetical protein
MGEALALFLAVFLLSPKLHTNMPLPIRIELSIWHITAIALN